MQAHTTIWGHALMGQGKIPEAIAEYRRTIEISPSDAFAHNNLGKALREQSSPPEIIAWEGVVTVMPLHKMEDAIKQFRLAVAFDPQNPSFHYNLGASLKDENIEEAITEYRRAIRLNHYYASAHYALAVALHERRQLPEAVTEYRSYLSTDPQSIEAHIKLGNALRELDHPDEAFAES